jgi:ubiquinone/menaquinone biosynthesis C-methylase UbiE
MRRDGVYGAAVVGAALLVFGLLRWDGVARPRPMAVWMERWFLDNPVRRAVFSPDFALKTVRPSRGAAVGEVGAGIGMVTRELVQAVGERGRVWAVDCQAQAAAAAQRRAGPTATVDVADARRLPWPDQSLDAVYAVAVLGEIPAADRLVALREWSRVLRPGGPLVIVEYGPDPHYLSPPRMRSLLEAAGLAVLTMRTGFWQYGVAAVPKSAKA